MTGQGVLPPPGDLVLIPLGRPPGRDLYRPADPVQQHSRPGLRVLHPKPPPALFGDPGQPFEELLQGTVLVLAYAVL